VQPARDHAISCPIASAAFTAHAARVLPEQSDPARVLGIDEIRRGRARFVFDEATQHWCTSASRWHAGFVDLCGGQGLLGQIEGRTAQAVTDRLQARGQQWKDAVRFVAIDMSTVFKAAVCQVLPHAVLVVDHFHIVQLANAALTEARRRVTLQQRGRRGRKGNREWELRNRLTRSAARMHGRYPDPMALAPYALRQKIGRPILAAWNAKKDLLDLLALARTRPDRHVISHRLTRFYQACAYANLPEFERLATTISAWGPQILAFIHSGVTNAGSAGTNRVLKTIARDAYGFRNPASQRLRTRAGTTRKARGHLNPA
jgi:transposase